MIPVFALLALGGRQTIDLDAGWQFTRVPSRPSVWNGPDAVPTANWHVQSVSSQETKGENAPATNAFDGNPNTFWHSEWQDRQAPYPHQITIDLGASTTVVGIRLLPRQTGVQNGHPHHFKLILTDGQDGLREIRGTVPDSANLFEQRFDPIKGRYLHLIFEDGYKAEPFLALAEIGLIRPTVKGSDWASQYDIANVTTGDARFDPTPADLEKLRAAETKTLKNWQPATLPHAAWIRPLNSPEIWQGVAYYRRQIPAPPAGQRTVLELQGMQSTDVWLNGKLIGQRRGGYLPLHAEIKEGGDLLVRVDNSDNPLIPPGKAQSDLDFMYGAGLVGHATLTSTDPLHLAGPLEGGGIYIDPPVLGRGIAITTAHALVKNEGARSRKLLVRQTLLDADGVTAVSATRSYALPAKATVALAQPLTVPGAKLWSPDAPYLYRLRTTLEENGSVVDAKETRIGLRTLSVSREKGFVINGKPIRLVGTNRHQDYPWVGPALSDAAERRDALLIKRAGHNIVRLSHYNQSPAFLDACDEFGILTIPCIPGWQFINNDPRFKARVLRDIRETVRRDRSHASVAWWEASLNETYPPAALAKTWYDTAKSEGAQLVSGDDTPNAPWDVIYNGWKEDLSRPQNTPKPGYIREYGDYEFGGGTSTSRVRIGEGTAKLLEETWNHVWSDNKFRPQYPATMGAGTWEMFDHNVPWAYNVSASGLADLMRREKPSFWFFASQQSNPPYLRIAVTEPPPEGDPGKSFENLDFLKERGKGNGIQGQKVVVFTNASSATLYLNGKEIRAEQAVAGPETPYSLLSAFDGNNTANLAHPPIVFRGIDFDAGELKVVGANGTEARLRIPGKPDHLRVWVDDLGIAPTTNDLVFVRAAVVDANGVVCGREARRINFTGATFAGETSAPCEMGIASVLVRTTSPTQLTIRATLDNLKGQCSLTVGAVK